MTMPDKTPLNMKHQGNSVHLVSQRYCATNPFLKNTIASFLSAFSGIVPGEGNQIHLQQSKYCEEIDEHKV